MAGPGDPKKKKTYRAENPFAKAPTDSTKAPSPYRPENPFAGHGAGRDFGDAPMPTSNAVIAGMGNGSTLGFADEALGALDALDKAGSANLLTSAGRAQVASAYRTGRDKVRGTLAQAKQEHPVAEFGGEIGGAILSAPSGSAKIVKGVPLGTALLRGMGTGAAVGGVAGFGNAEGSAGQQATSAAVGTVGGLLVGAAVPASVRTVSRLLDLARVRPAATTQAAEAVQQVLGSITDPKERQQVIALIENDPRLSSAFKRGTGRGPGVTAYSNPIGPAIDEAVSTAKSGVNTLRRGVRAATGNRMETTDERAVGLLAQKLAQNKGQTPATIRAALANVPEDVPVTPMEMFGEPTRQLAMGARTVGSARQLLTDVPENRVRTQFSRLADPISKVLNPKGEEYEAATQAIIKSRDEAARPLYQKVFSSPQAAAVVDERLSPEFMQRPTMQAALKNGVALAKDFGVTVALPADGEAPSAQLLHYTRMALGDMIEQRALPADAVSAATQGGTGKARLAAASKIQRTLGDVLKERVPGYREASKVFAGPTETLKFAKLGTEAFSPKMTTQKLAQKLATATPEDMQLYRLGVDKRIREMLAKPNYNRDLINAVLDNQETLARLRLAYPDEAEFQALLNRLAPEREIATTRNVVARGSQTADKQSIQAELAGAGSSIPDAIAGGQAGIVRGLFNAGKRTLYDGVTNRTAEALAPRLTAGSGGGAAGRAEFNALLDAIEAAAKKQQRSAAGQRATAGAITNLGASRIPRQ